MTFERQPADIILASSSPWRKQLLESLQLDFSTISPDIDETPGRDEFAVHLVQRLARGKCMAVAEAHGDRIVIGSDQVADLDGRIIGKPGSREAAIEQLKQQSGRTVLFHTGLCVKSPGLSEPMEDVVTVKTRFKRLTEDQITRYVDAEDVTATAGSIKSEGLGIALVEAISSDDPSALIGLPLISLCSMLKKAGVTLP